MLHLPLSIECDDVHVVCKTSISVMPLLSAFKATVLTPSYDCAFNGMDEQPCTLPLEYSDDVYTGGWSTCHRSKFALGSRMRIALRWRPPSATPLKRTRFVARKNTAVFFLYRASMVLANISTYGGNTGASVDALAVPREVKVWAGTFLSLAVCSVSVCYNVFRPPPNKAANKRYQRLMCYTGKIN